MALNTNLMATAKGDVMICDHDLHASLVDGALPSVARVMRFLHNDLDHFERRLNNRASEEKILVVSEGVFSMEGDLAELHGLVDLSFSATKWSGPSPPQFLPQTHGFFPKVLPRVAQALESVRELGIQRRARLESCHNLKAGNATRQILLRSFR